MKALTLTQPWAQLVALNAKQIETRSWSTQYRGTLAIHAAKGFPPEARRLCALQEPFRSVLREAGFNVTGPLKADFMPLGVVVATCRLVDCIRVTHPQVYFGVRTDSVLRLPPEEPELSFGDYTPGRYAWILTDIKPLATPIPCKGALSLWDVTTK